MSASIDRIAAGIAAHGLIDGDRRLPTQPLGDAEWSGLTDVCLRERLVCLFYDAVRVGEMPATMGQRDKLASLQKQLLALQLRLEARLLQVAAVLDSHGLDYRILKGVALATTVYPDVRQRHFHDIDILARADQLGVVERVLTEDAGYRRRVPQLRAGFDRRYAKSITMVDVDGSELDVHRTLVRGACGIALDLDALWASTRTASVAGAVLPALSPDGQLLHATLGAALSDVPARLSTLRDVAQLAVVDGVGARRLADLAAHHGVTVPVARGIILTERVLDVRLGDLGTWAAGTPLDSRGRRQLAEYPPGGRFRRQALDVARALNWRDRIRYLTALALPSREFLTSQGVGRREWVRNGASPARATRPEHSPDC